MMYINDQRAGGSLVSYTPPAQEGEEEEDDAGRENFLCLREVRNREAAKMGCSASMYLNKVFSFYSYHSFFICLFSF